MTLWMAWALSGAGIVPSHCANFMALCENLSLGIGLRLNQLRGEHMADQRRRAMIPQSAGVNRGWDELVSQRVHHQERCIAGNISKIIFAGTFSQSRTGARFDRNQSQVLSCSTEFVSEKRESQAGEIASASMTRDDDIGVVSRLFHLLQRLLPDDRLMQKDMVEYAAQRVLGVIALDCILDRFRNGKPKTSGRVGIFCEHACVLPPSDSKDWPRRRRRTFSS